MDLLASIFAYCGAVAALIVAIAMSYDALVYAPLHHRIGPSQTLVVAAKPTATENAAKPSAALARGGLASLPARQRDGRGIAASEPAAQADVTLRTANARRSSAEHHALTQRRFLRRQTRPDRPREWASRQWPDRLGYADEPHAVFDYEPFQ